jgi:outer membrane protein
LVLLAGVIAPFQASAQKIAVIDMQGAILQTKEGQQASNELKAKFGPKEQEMAKRNQDLAAKQAQYQKTAATLSDAARASAEREITTLEKNLKRDTDDAQADVQAEENRLLGGILQKMQGVMQKYAIDKQISMIVDLSSQPNNLLYADKSVNITADVIALYDKAAAAPKPAPAAAAPKPPAATTTTPKATAPASKPPAKP